MATAKKICRVCGKEYEACHSLSKDYSVFRWKEVACSPECGAIYLKQIEESRKPAVSKTGKSAAVLSSAVASASAESAGTAAEAADVE